MSIKWKESHHRKWNSDEVTRLRYFFDVRHIRFNIQCDVGDEWYLNCNEIGFDWWKIGEPYKSDGSNMDNVKHIALRLVFSRIGTIHETLEIELEKVCNVQ